MNGIVQHETAHALPSPSSTSTVRLPSYNCIIGSIFHSLRSETPLQVFCGKRPTEYPVGSPFLGLWFLCFLFQTVIPEPSPVFFFKTREAALPTENMPGMMVTVCFPDTNQRIKYTRYTNPGPQQHPYLYYMHPGVMISCDIVRRVQGKIRANEKRIAGHFVNLAQER